MKKLKILILGMNVFAVCIGIVNFLVKHILPHIGFGILSEYIFLGFNLKALAKPRNNVKL